MKRTIFNLGLLFLSVFLFGCGSQGLNQQDNYGIVIKDSCINYKGSIEIVVLSYDKDNRIFTSHYKGNEYTLSPNNREEKDIYDYSNPSYALLVFGKGGNPFLVTDRDTIQMEDGNYITVTIKRYSENKSVPIKSVLIQD